MKVQKTALFMILLSLLSVFAFAQDQTKASQSVPGKKLEVFFSELETQWLKAEQNKDPTALNGIVSDDFQLVSSAPPGKSISRSDWLLVVFSRKLLSFNVRQLAVREISPTLKVVSFVQTENFQQPAATQTENRFVVDIWINSGAGDNWRCTGRYTSEIASTAKK